MSCFIQLIQIHDLATPEAEVWKVKGHLGQWSKCLGLLDRTSQVCDPVKGLSSFLVYLRSVLDKSLPASSVYYLSFSVVM